jgi:FtsP/CotA-like multicopper oxidase with cupredoxin domain
MLMRRDFLKAGGLAGAGLLRTSRAEARSDVGVSRCPTTPPFKMELPIPQVCAERSALDGMRPELHQHYAEYVPRQFHEMRVQAFNHRFHPNLRNTLVWGYDGKMPGPTFHARYGTPIMCRIHNELPPDHVGFGIPEISTHLHNSHTASESDGFPADFYGPGKWHDHHYCASFAGNDAREALGTLWYHDHRLDFTAQNVYRGLAGFFLLFDDLDTGDETTGLQLPSGRFDVPLVFADKVFDAQSQLVFDFFNTNGILGDKFTVNGAIQPFMKVARRKYRFRLLDAGPSRFYEFILSSGQSFVQIASDGNLLAAPVARSAVRIGPAERVDVIIDFSQYNVGDSVYLLNQLFQDSGRGPEGILLNPATPLLRFDIDREEEDLSVIPVKLREQPVINLAEVVAKRHWIFNRLNGAWTINEKVFNVNEVRAAIKQNTAEMWTLENKSGGWSHPIHIHFEEFRILSRNGVAPPPWERGRKDVVVVGPNETVKIFMRFRDFVGRHPMHCHNTVHEDHAMMLRWDIVP